MYGSPPRSITHLPRLLRRRIATTVLLQAPLVTVKEFLKNFFNTTVGAEADVDTRELNVLQMKACVTSVAAVCALVWPLSVLVICDGISFVMKSQAL